MNSLKLHQPFARNAFQFSFVPHTVSLLNSHHPEQVAGLSTILDLIEFALAFNCTCIVTIVILGMHLISYMLLYAQYSTVCTNFNRKKKRIVHSTHLVGLYKPFFQACKLKYKLTAVKLVCGVSNFPFHCHIQRLLRLSWVFHFPTSFARNELLSQ